MSTPSPDDLPTTPSREEKRVETTETVEVTPPAPSRETVTETTETVVERDQ